MNQGSYGGETALWQVPYIVKPLATMGLAWAICTALISGEVSLKGGTAERRVPHVDKPLAMTGLARVTSPVTEAPAV